MLNVLIALLLSSYGESFFMHSSASKSRLQAVKLAPIMSDSSAVIPKSISDSIAQSALKKIPFYATPFLGVIAVSISKALAEETVTEAVPAKVELGPAPTDFGLKYNDYYSDAQKVVNHMRYASQVEKGNPVLVDVAQKTKDEMNDFVSYYRRFNGINGKQSFSLLYTSINVLAGHYTSYGTKFPVPEKRRKRLLQEFNDIEKNIRKKR